MIYAKPILLVAISLVISSCSNGEEIPEEKAQDIPEELIPNAKDAEIIDKETQSIKEAAAEAVQIIEDDMNREIDSIVITEDIEDDEADEADTEADKAEESDTN